MGLLTVELQDPTGYGRILRDSNNNIEAIVEQKDATSRPVANHRGQYWCDGAWQSTTAGLVTTNW